MRCARFTANRLEIVAHRLRRNPGLLCDAGHGASDRARHDEVRDFRRADAGFLQNLRDHRGNDLCQTLVANPALLPRVVEVFTGGTEMIDEVDGRRVRRDEFEQRLLVADRHRRRAVAEREFAGACRLRSALVGGDHERVPVQAALHGGNALNQGRYASALRRGDVHRSNVFAERQCGADDPGVLTICKGGAGARKQNCFGSGRSGSKAIARGFHAHGHGVFVPIAHRTLAARFAFESWIGPHVCGDDGLARQAQTRHIAAKSCDSDHVPSGDIDVRDRPAIVATKLPSDNAAHASSPRSTQLFSSAASADRA